MARTTSPGGEREMDGVEKAATLLKIGRAHV